MTDEYEHETGFVGPIGGPEPNVFDGSRLDAIAQNHRDIIDKFRQSADSRALVLGINESGQYVTGPDISTVEEEFESRYEGDIQFFYR